VRFVKPVRLGGTYQAQARVGRGRGRYWEAEGLLCDTAGGLYARGSGKYFLLTEEQTAAVAGKLTYLPDDMPVFRDHPVRSAPAPP
jgi:hypothetical protein